MRGHPQSRCRPNFWVWIWGRIGVDLGGIWGHSGVSLGSIRGHPASEGQLGRPPGPPALRTTQPTRRARAPLAEAPEGRPCAACGESFSPGERQAGECAPHSGEFLPVGPLPGRPPAAGWSKAVVGDLGPQIDPGSTSRSTADHPPHRPPDQASRPTADQPRSTSDPARDRPRVDLQMDPAPTSGSTSDRSRIDPDRPRHNPNNKRPRIDPGSTSRSPPRPRADPQMGPGSTSRLTLDRSRSAHG